MENDLTVPFQADWGIHCFISCEILEKKKLLAAILFPIFQKEAVEAAGPGSSAPTLFNPSQFTGNQSAKQPPGGAGHRLSSRRVYPK